MADEAAAGALLTERDLREMPHARLLGDRIRIGNVRIDSRRCDGASLFVALPGTNTDGHRFIEDAVRNGAAACIVKESEYEQAPSRFSSLRERWGAAFLVAEDPLEVLQALSRRHMARLPDTVTLGITGSSGKTTTKEIIGAVLSAEYSTAVSFGNLNSEIGLPLAAFEVKPEHDYAVFELGINHPGEMDILTGIIRPVFGVVTNIGSAHIGLLGSREGIAREKRKIFSCLPEHGAGFLYEDEEWKAFLQAGAGGRFIEFGRRSTPGFAGAENLNLEGWDIRYHGHAIHFPLFGEHNLRNALCGISVGEYLGVSPEGIKAGLETIRPLSNRGEIVKGPVTIIRDCYNANLESVAATVEFVKHLPWQGRKIAVLGSMLEQGGEAERAHLKLGEVVGNSDFDAVFLYGREMEHAVRGAAGIGSRIALATGDFDKAVKALLQYLRPGDLALVKGSLGMDMARFADAVTAEFPSSPEPVKESGVC